MGNQEARALLEHSNAKRKETSLLHGEVQRALPKSTGKIFVKGAVDWIQNGELDQLGAYLVSGMVHGKPGLPTAQLNLLEKTILKAFSDEELFQLGRKLLKRPEYTARGLGISFVERGWPRHKEVKKLILIAAEDEDWIVREIAAGSFARLLNKDFPHFSKLFAVWARSDSVNAKRAVALAVKYDAKVRDPKKWKTYMKLIEPLLTEEAEYIRKNLGPFAIGDGLLARYPEETLAACQRWANSRNSWVRWNAAMVFTAAGARKHVKAGSKILASLLEDPEPMVVRAAKRAVKNLAK